MDRESPTIKGIFVKSHVDAVKKEKGAEGLQELEKMFGAPLTFSNSQNVPVKDEVRLIECAVKLLTPEISENEIPLEAGRLHFRDFSTTPFGRIIFSMFKNNFKLMMMQSKNIAGHIFNGVQFSAEDLGENAVKITSENNDYNLQHFKGLFEEWMRFSGHKGTVDARAITPTTFEYTLSW